MLLVSSGKEPNVAKCSKVNRTDPTTRSSPVPNVTVPRRRNPDLAYDK